MKRIFVITILIIGLAAAYSFAQMGHGMMRGTEEEMGQGHMMEQGHMMGSMMGVTQDMSVMMRRMSGMMGGISNMSREMSGDRMHNMSNMMRDMCREMSRMADFMDKGAATDEEMKAMRNRMMEMQKQMPDLMR